MSDRPPASVYQRPLPHAFIPKANAPPITAHAAAPNAREASIAEVDPGPASITSAAARVKGLACDVSGYRTTLPGRSRSTSARRRPQPERQRRHLQADRPAGASWLCPNRRPSGRLWRRSRVDGPRASRRGVARGVDIPPTTPCKAGRQGTRFAIGGRRCRTDGKGGRRAKRRRPPLRQALSWVRAQEGAISRRPFQDVCDERCA